MSLSAVNGIVIRYCNYRDNDRILTLFTKERGRVDALARGCRKPKSQLLPCSELFFCGEFIVFKNRDRYIVNSCSPIETFYPIRNDVNRLSAASYISARTLEGVRPDAPNLELYSLLYHCLSFLAYSQQHHADIAICFLAKYLKNCGYQPTITACASCGSDLRKSGDLGFSPQAGGALCANCRGYSPSISTLSLEALRRILLLDGAELNRARLPEQARGELMRCLHEYACHTAEKCLPAPMFV